MSSKDNDSAMFRVDPSLPDQVSEADLFDWRLYGVTIRNKRTKMGYKTAEAFAKTIWRRTRVTIPTPSIYKIEQGKQIPDAMQFMALNIAVSGEPYPRKLIYGCVSDEWEYIENNQDIPQGWKMDNYHEAETNGTLRISELNEIIDCDDEIKLFE